MTTTTEGARVGALPLPLSAPALAAAGLYPAEIRVVLLLGQGQSNTEIARTLSCSKHTVKRHLSNVSEKLEANNRTHILAIALAISLHNPSPDPISASASTPPRTARGEAAR